MSDITTERWSAHGEEVHTDGNGAFTLVAECCTAERARTVAVLPEALALLQNFMTAHENMVDQVESCLCAWCAPGRDVLRRAGVLP